jgi:DNA polymerase (family X)
LASWLELVDGNPYTVRAYRHAAETTRGAAFPVAEPVRSGRARELRGIGRGIEARLGELGEKGEIAELAELEREVAPDLVGLGRYLGLGATSSVEPARTLGVQSGDEFAGRLPRTGCGRCRASGRRPRRAAARGPRPRGRAAGAARAAARPCLGARVGVAAALGGEAAGDVRRWRDSCERLAVAVFVGSGDHRSAEAFSDDFAPAIVVAAGLSFAGPIAGVALAGPRQATDARGRQSPPVPAIERDGGSRPDPA